jgi:ribonuclease HII
MTESKDALVAGIDEAGRGCVLGPMVLAVAVIKKSQEKELKEIGVKDSKLLSPKRREELFEIINKQAVEYKLVAVPAEELNVLMKKYSLNEIEAQKIAELLISLKSKIDTLIVDSPDTIPDKFKKRIEDNLVKQGSSIGRYTIKSEHKADLNHVSVATASILAKVTRDKLLEELIGKNISGYSSDPRTIEYLKNYILKNKKLPEFARTEWQTIDNIMKELYQKKIGWFK